MSADTSPLDQSPINPPELSIEQALLIAQKVAAITNNPQRDIDLANPVNLQPYYVQGALRNAIRETSSMLSGNGSTLLVPIRFRNELPLLGYIALTPHKHPFCQLPMAIDREEKEAIMKLYLNHGVMLDDFYSLFNVTASDYARLHKGSLDFDNPHIHGTIAWKGASEFSPSLQEILPLYAQRVKGYFKCTLAFNPLVSPVRMAEEFRKGLGPNYAWYDPNMVQS